LTCSCKDITNKNEDMELQKNGEEARIEIQKDIFGSCICQVDGNEKSFDRVVLNVETKTKSEKKIDIYEKEFERIKAKFRGKPFVYSVPIIIPRVLDRINL